MATYEARTSFFTKSAETLATFDKGARALAENIMEPAKKINVSTAFAVVNRIGHTATETNNSVRTILAAIDACLTTFKSNSHNIGDYRDMVNHACNVVSDCIPGVYVYDEISESADGNESMTQANLDEFVEYLTTYTKLAHDTLKEVSAARGSIRGEDNPTVNNIGKNLETFTNSVIRQCKAIADQVNQMAADYGLENRKLEEATSALSAIEATDTNPDVSFGGDSW